MARHYRKVISDWDAVCVTKQEGFTVGKTYHMYYPPTVLMQSSQ